MKTEASVVLFVILTKVRENSGEFEFAFMPKQDTALCFPVTKYRKDEDLYTALSRIMSGDLKLPEGTFFPEIELPMMKQRELSKHYQGLMKDYYLYPVEVSITPNARETLFEQKQVSWFTVDEIKNKIKDANILAITDFLKNRYHKDFKLISQPSMDALANYWAKQSNSGVRKVSKNDITDILKAGNRAFNLRVADPYLPYQRQGLGFTWSFFTPKDKQDIHVHGQPAVEIYGVMEGQFVLWHKPMYERGALVWKKEVLNAGDWIEVEALHCHFGYWTTKDGYGTVIKAAGTGELAGVGRIGVSGKTVCKECPVEKQCQKHPEMEPILAEFQKPFAERNWDEIEKY